MPRFHPGADALDGTQTKFIYPYKTPERFKTNPPHKGTQVRARRGESRSREYISQNSKALAKRDKPI